MSPFFSSLALDCYFSNLHQENNKVPTKKKTRKFKIEYGIVLGCMTTFFLFSLFMGGVKCKEGNL